VIGIVGRSAASAPTSTGRGSARSTTRLRHSTTVRMVWSGRAIVGASPCARLARTACVAGVWRVSCQIWQRMSEWCELIRKRIWSDRFHKPSGKGAQEHHGLTSPVSITLIPASRAACAVAMFAASSAGP
jgi:hypothetical protein